ncbi:MAG: cupredoxin domain-containing protein [Bdellovibrionaceae bacterium]|nr:cupredoxin domain-containing protein [Pseudobdellovibrionaceae bacterium]
MKTVLTSFCMILALMASSALAQEMAVHQIVLKDHKFEPSVLKVKAGEKFKLEVKNEDASTEEFESNVLNIEKFVGPKKTLKLTLGPLKPGKYPFFGEFHQSTANGVIEVEE